MLRLILIVVGSLFSVLALAQNGEHPFMRSFVLTVLDGRVQVAWTLQGGSTCDGIEVQRSSNGTDFATIHRIDGICGDPILDVPFGFRDDAPPEFSRIHYRIALGIEGVSSTKSVDFTQLKESEQRFFPSPMRNTATLLLNVPGPARVDLWIFDAAGRQVWERNGLIGQQHELELGFLQAGYYAYMAISEGKRFQGRFVKE
jgi:hypothetical protein